MQQIDIDFAEEDYRNLSFVNALQLSKGIEDKKTILKGDKVLMAEKVNQIAQLSQS